MILPYPRKDLFTIGRLVTKKYPEIAAEVLSTYQSEMPFDTDLSNIPRYLKIFSQNEDLTKNNRLFVGCLISIYAPEALKCSDMGRTGLITTTAQLLGKTHQYISILAREAILYYKIYDEFRESVDSITEKMKA